MPTFTISVNNKVLGTYVVKKTVISIGRSRTNTISIASKAVSRTHVRIELTREGWSVADLGSLNGTYVNDIRITSAFLSEGDKVTVGAYTVLFSPEPSQAAVEEELRPAAQAESPEGTDTDVRVEGVPPATETAIAPAKDQPNPPPGPQSMPPEPERAVAAASLEETVEKTSDAAPEVSVPPETRNYQIPAQPYVDEQEKRAEGEEDQRKKNDRLALLRSNPAGLQLEDRIRLAIFENPLADETGIRKRLSDGDFGGATIGRSELQSLLKRLGLETKIKRYQYFLHS
jgi:pSer/pThr/pTyr-binding forkhead associated (FHA) protein